MAETEIKTVKLEVPIKRGENEVTEIRMRRPVSGDLRGISMGKLGQMDYDEMRKLLPRISLDALLVEEVDRIDTADMMEVAVELTDFLFTSRRQEEFRNA